MYIAYIKTTLTNLELTIVCQEKSLSLVVTVIIQLYLCCTSDQIWNAVMQKIKLSLGLRPLFDILACSSGFAHNIIRIVINLSFSMRFTWMTFSLKWMTFALIFYLMQQNLYQNKYLETFYSKLVCCLHLYMNALSHDQSICACLAIYIFFPDARGHVWAVENVSWEQTVIFWWCRFPLNANSFVDKGCCR